MLDSSFSSIMYLPTYVCNCELCPFQAFRDYNEPSAPSFYDQGGRAQFHGRGGPPDRFSLPAPIPANASSSYGSTRQSGPQPDHYQNDYQSTQSYSQPPYGDVPNRHPRSQFQERDDFRQYESRPPYGQGPPPNFRENEHQFQNRPAPSSIANSPPSYSNSAVSDNHDNSPATSYNSPNTQNAFYRTNFNLKEDEPTFDDSKVLLDWCKY